jgi:hypothetical protein
MKKNFLVVTTTYLFLNLLLASSFITPQQHKPQSASSAKKFCGPLEFRINNTAGYPVTRVSLYSNNNSWLIDDPTFPLIIPGAPFESGNYTIRIALADDLEGSIRVSDRQAGPIACETFASHFTAPVKFAAYCSWYDIEISPIYSCP